MKKPVATAKPFIPNPEAGLVYVRSQLAKEVADLILVKVAFLKTFEKPWGAERARAEGAL